MKIKGKKQLEETKNINISSKPLKRISFLSIISVKAKKLMEDIKLIDDWLESAQLLCTKTDGKTKYDFNKFTLPLKFISKIFSLNITLQEAKDGQQELKILINKLSNDYNPLNQIKIKEKDNTLKSAKNCF